jgi:hypothetical protein
MELPSAKSPEAEAQAARDEERLRRERLVAGGARWFYAIAGLSALNSLVYAASGSLSFFVGLTVTQIVDGVVAGFGQALAPQGGPGAVLMGRLAGLALDLALAGAFAYFGVQTRRRHSRPVMAGVGLYLLDGVLSLVFLEWLGVAFHALMLWGAWRGMKALNELEEMEKERCAL